MPESPDQAATSIQAGVRGMISRNWARFQRMSRDFEKWVSDHSAKSIQEFVEWRVYRNFGFISRKVGRRIRGTAINIDPFMPRQGKDLVGDSFDSLWPQISAGVLANLEARLMPDKQKLERKRQRRAEILNPHAWPDAPPFWPDPFHWFRAGLLYAWMPADKTFFARLRDRATWPWLVLLLFPSPQVNLALWLILLLNLRSMGGDEYQLTSFTVLYRASAFLSIGVAWSIMGFFKLYACSSGDTFDCNVRGPGTGALGLQTMIFAMLRMLLGSWAFTSLVDMRVAKARTAQAAETDMRRRMAIKLPHAIDLGAARGSHVGMTVGLLLGAGVILRGEYLWYTSVRGAERGAEQGTKQAFAWVSPINASACILWVCEMFGMAVGGWAPVVQKVAPLLAKATMKWLSRHLSGLLSTGRATCHRCFQGSSRAATSAEARQGDEEAPDAPLVEPRSTPSQPQGAGGGASADKLDAAVIMIQRIVRGRQGRREVERIMREPSTRHVSPLTWLMLWDASCWTTLLVFSLASLHARVGPDELLGQASHEYYAWDGLGIAQFLAWAWMIFSDGLLLHWRVRSAIYFMLALGALVTYWPFLLIKVPLLGAKLLKVTAKRTAYDRAGELREVLGPKQAYELYVMQQAAEDEMDADPEAPLLMHIKPNKDPDPALLRA